jgi:hypothetical protein
MLIYVLGLALCDWDGSLRSVVCEEHQLLVAQWMQANCNLNKLAPGVSLTDHRMFLGFRQQFPWDL